MTQLFYLQLNLASLDYDHLQAFLCVGIFFIGKIWLTKISLCEYRVLTQQYEVVIRFRRSLYRAVYLKVHIIVAVYMLKAKSV